MFTVDAGPALGVDGSMEHAAEDGSAVQTISLDPSASAGSPITSPEAVAVHGAGLGQACDTSSFMPGPEVAEKTVALVTGPQVLDVIKAEKRPMDMTPQLMAEMCMKWRNMSIQEVCNESSGCVPYAF